MVCFKDYRQILDWWRKNIKKYHKFTERRRKNRGSNINLVIFVFTSLVLFIIRRSMCTLSLNDYIEFQLSVCNFSSKCRRHKHDFYAVSAENSVQFSNFKHSRQLELLRYWIRSCGLIYLILKCNLNCILNVKTNQISLWKIGKSRFSLISKIIQRAITLWFFNIFMKFFFQEKFYIFIFYFY